MIGMEDHGEANADLTPVESLQALFKQVTLGTLIRERTPLSHSRGSPSGSRACL